MAIADIGVCHQFRQKRGKSDS